MEISISPSAKWTHCTRRWSRAVLVSIARLVIASTVCATSPLRILTETRLELALPGLNEVKDLCAQLRLSVTGGNYRARTSASNELSGAGPRVTRP